MFATDGSLLWTSEELGIDGVVVNDFDHDIIRGDGEWDPPGGWRPFAVNANNGKIIAENQMLCRSFVRQAKEALSQHPYIKHEWSIDDDEDHCILDIPEESDSGFPITVEVYPDEITVIASGAHTQLQLEGNPDELAAHALGLRRY